MAYALGLYDLEVRENLDIIRKIRNAFAHTPQAIHFEMDEICKEVAKLKFEAFKIPEAAKVSEHRQRFMFACMGFVVASRLKPLGNRFALIKQVVEAINPHLPAAQRFPPDLAEKLEVAVEAIKKVKP